MKDRTELRSRSGIVLLVRAVAASDHGTLKEFYARVDKEDLWYRFFAGIDHMSDARIRALTDVDHETVENYLAFGRDGVLLAVGTLACDPGLERAEVAITVRSDRKKLGIGWSLLGHLSAVARAKGMKVIEAVEQRANFAALTIEREMGFSLSSDPNDPSLVVAQLELL